MDNGSAWLFTRWVRQSRQDALDAAADHQQLEYRAAVRRILDEPTDLLPAVQAPVPRVTPLLTPGQLHRSRRPGP
jgi:hypothetical protein